MRKLFNIRLKDVPNARLIAIKSIRDEFNLGMKDAKDIVEELLDKGEVIAEGTHTNIGSRYNVFNEEAFRVEPLVNKLFDCEFISESLMNDYGGVIPVPDPETESALEWYNSLTDGEKRRIDLIGRWQNPVCVAGGAAFGGLNMSFD